MANLSELDLQNLRHLMGGYDAEKAGKEFSVLPDSIENLPLKIKIFDSYMRDYHFDEAYEFLKNLDSNYEESSYILNAYGLTID